MVDRKDSTSAVFLKLSGLSTTKLTHAPTIFKRGFEVGFKELEFVTKIRDPIHDTIPITQLEQKIIDSSEFQRLRRVQQTAFLKFVFPGANHSRFEHSLGAMHMAQKLFSSLIQNQVQILKKQKKEQVSSYQIEHPSIIATEEVIKLLQKNSYPLQCMRVAALLHDIGHSPLSHSGEMLMPTWETIFKSKQFKDLPEFLQTGFLKKCDGKTQKKVKHEIYTLMLAEKLLSNVCGIDQPHCAQDVCSLIDTSISPALNSPLNFLGLRNLLHEIVSGEIDADRMDYLLRDSKQCGVVYGLFDCGRIMDSIFFYYNDKSMTMCMAIKKSGLAAFEDFLRARWSMYQQVYFHRTSTACEAVVSYVFKNITQLTLPVDLDDYLKIDDWSFIDFASDIIIKSNNKNKEFIKKTLVELIKERKIWKIIYEENLEKHSGSRSQSVSKLIVAELERKKIPCSHVESSKSLTKFSPLRNNKENQNTFMVLSQSSYSQLKLTPIENESKLICKLEDEIIIRRIFASPTTAEGDRVPLDELRAHIDSMVSY